jgi:hypothetical protein
MAPKVFLKESITYTTGFISSNKKYKGQLHLKFLVISKTYY